MTLFTDNEILSQEIESRILLAGEEQFLQMLRKLNIYSTAIYGKPKLFPSEPVIMALLLEQLKIIGWLQSKYSIGSEHSE